jgi:hypothetical protein
MPSLSRASKSSRLCKGLRKSLWSIEARIKHQYGYEEYKKTDGRKRKKRADLVNTIWRGGGGMEEKKEVGRDVEYMSDASL